MSKSWIIMSRKMPPETSMYGIGGGAGSRLVMRTMCRSPTEPSITAARTEACAASKRRLKPTWNGTPLDSITASASSTLPRSSEIGFSQKIALPACAAAIMNGTWVSVLLQIATASTSADASTASTSVVCGHVELLADGRCRVSVDVLHHRQRGTGHLPGDQLGVHPADAADAEHCDSECHCGVSCSEGFGASPAPMTDWS